MKPLSIYQVDAFTDHLFGGNPAAVVPLEDWLDDALMQQIALENNLSETAFFVATPGTDADFYLRWFAPAAEVDLCGHATLASAWVIFNKLGWSGESITLTCKSGLLGVAKKADNWLELDFPYLRTTEVPVPAALKQSVAGAAETVHLVTGGGNYLVELENEAAVRALSPDMSLLRKLGQNGVIVTAPGDHSDFASRYFAPAFGFDEDPVTGSIHSVLTPFWAERLNKSDLLAHQVSARGGVLKCQLRNDRVAIAGQAAFYMEGTIHL
ncbi:PhzF family phenazine biosynthesis protein [Marinobacter salicampi]|uniref:PhzF family phenazine biosynthesis protein n=1 Tax=Marinobacter salicampi TaxID=435907 RepID=UPI00140A5D0E|nr:PhzF family phenazine biosynthesis protein [Marinobacter salicampi]